jgi:hypothetical protein
MAEARWRQSDWCVVTMTPPEQSPTSPRFWEDLEGDFPMTTNEPTACPNCYGTGQIPIMQPVDPTHRRKLAPVLCPKPDGSLQCARPCAVREIELTSRAKKALLFPRCKNVAFGTKRTFVCAAVMSAFGGKADIAISGRHVCF